MDIVIRINDDGMRVLIPEGCQINYIFTAAGLLLREADKIIDLMEVKDAMMNNAIQKVAALPEGMKRV